MTPDEAVRYVEEREILGMRFGLERMQRLLGLLGDPQRGRPAIHVVGTNGKTSTTRYAAAALRAAGLRVGAYTSPHITHWRERIQVDGVPITEDAFARAVGAVADAAVTFADDPVTQFEVLTAAAFVALHHAGVDALVVEAGLGGRYDASNVLEDAVVVLTNVSREHTDLLGDTEYAIAGEKLAVARDGSDRLVVGPLTPVAYDAVRRIAADRGLSGWWAGEDIRIEDVDARRVRVTTPLGRYTVDAGPTSVQRWNMAVALAAAERRLGDALPSTAVVAALASVANPGRFEMIEGRPVIILDGAHNPAGMSALAEDLPAGRRIVAVLSILRDKDRPGMLAPLRDRVAHVVTTASRNPRVTPAAELGRAVHGEGMDVDVVEHPEDAVARAREIAGPDGIVIVCGSLYLLSDVRDAILRRWGLPPGKLARETPGNGRN